MLPPLGNTPRTWSPIGWQYIVTEVAQYKELRPPKDPALIKVFRTILGNTILARSGIYGAATDTVQVPGSAATYHIHHHRLNHLTWSAEQAPLLVDVAAPISGVHQAIPRYCLQIVLLRFHPRGQWKASTLLTMALPQRTGAASLQGGHISSDLFPLVLPEHKLSLSSHRHGWHEGQVRRGRRRRRRRMRFVG